MRLRDTEEFKRGRRGEQVVAALFQAAGYYVIPSYDYGGEDGNKAPKLCGAKASYAVPDLDIARRGLRKWVEVKTKSKAILYRIRNEFRHGIEKRLWEHYRHVQAITGCPVEICIYELDTGELLKASLDELGAPVQLISKWQYGPGAIVVWPRRRFRPIGWYCDALRMGDIDEHAAA